MVPVSSKGTCNEPKHMQKQTKTWEQKSYVAALKKDREQFPKKMTTHNGDPVWEGSRAQAYLIMDVRLGNYKNVKPADFHLTCTVYSAFSLKVFCNHIYQQEKREKWVAYLQRTQKKKFNLSDEAA